MKDWIIKRKSFFGGLLCAVLLFVFCGTYFTVKASSLPKPEYTIVLDAGHGGRDGGCVGVNGSIEKDLNLKYVLSLKQKLQALKYNVVLTRSTDAGLYSPFAKDKKISDMNARMNTIKQANPNLVISIHMNSFSDGSINGANCFYKIDDEASKVCASLIQKALQEDCMAKTDKVKFGDYFMLNCSYYTSVLIECGFLSNRQDEENLNNKDYMDKFTTAICNAIVLYLG